MRICRICLRKPYDNNKQNELVLIKDEIKDELNLEFNHFPRWICIKCEHIVLAYTKLKEIAFRSNENLMALEHQKFTKNNYNSAIVSEMKTVNQQLKNDDSQKNDKNYFEINETVIDFNNDPYPFYCIYCNKGYSHRETMLQHVARIHEKKYKCDLCDRYFGAKGHIKRHVSQVHSGVVRRKYKPRVTKEMQLASSHNGITMIKECSITKNTLRHNEYICHHCNARSRNKGLLLRHLRAKHFKTFKNETKFLCTKCGVLCETQRKLTTHVSNHHSRIEKKARSIPEELKGLCKICGSKFDNKSDLIRHVKEHTLIYKCNFCLRKFASQVRLDNHSIEHEGNTYSYECPYHCGGKYQTKNRLNKHIKKVHLKNNENHSCNICYKTLYSDKSLQLHMKLHSGSFDYNCFFCEKKFLTSRRLKAHLIAAHTNSRYQCPKCDTRCICQRGIESHLKKQHSDLWKKQPDVSVFFEKDEPKHSHLLEMYSQWLNKKS